MMLLSVVAHSFTITVSSMNRSIVPGVNINRFILIVYIIVPVVYEPLHRAWGATREAGAWSLCGYTCTT